MPEQHDLDERIRAYYGSVFDEGARLTTRSAQGPLEHRRTQEIIAEHASGGRVIDIGGGTGSHAIALRHRGFEVVLVEPVPEHVAAAESAGLEAVLADARHLPFDDDAFDTALLLGPLYHLVAREDRLEALREAARVAKSGGFLFVAALSRFVAFGKATLGGSSTVDDTLKALLEHGTPPDGLRFPAGHFHTADELAAEIVAAGLDLIAVHGVEGPAGLGLEEFPVDRTELTDAALLLARAGSTQPGIRDLSPHLLAVAQIP